MSMIELMEMLLCNVLTVRKKIVAMITASHCLLFTVIFSEQSVILLPSNHTKFANYEY